MNATRPRTPGCDVPVTGATGLVGRVAAPRVLRAERAVLLLEGQVAVPRAALDAGFVSAHPTLSGALENLLPK